MVPARDCGPDNVEGTTGTDVNLAPADGIHTASQVNGEEQWTPETVLSTLDPKPTTNSTSPVPFFHLLERLKTTKREGFRRFGIQHGESIADHMYRMSIITMCCPPSLASRVDLAKCTRMALVHDMAESLVGDITPVDGVTKQEKSRREGETMEYLCTGLLGNFQSGVAGQSIRELWQEYEDDRTMEAHFVHDVDKLELLLQMIEYERAVQGRIDLSEFTWVATRVVLPEVREWVEEVLAERASFWEDIKKMPHAAAQEMGVEKERRHVRDFEDGTSIGEDG